MIKYVLFDLDGTLVDTSEGILQSIAMALNELDVENIDTEKMKSFIGPPLKAAFMDYCGMSPEQAGEATKVFRKFYNESGKYVCKLYDGITETLSKLKENGYVVAVATSKPTVFAVDILRFLHIDHYFDEIVGSNLDNTRSSKHEVIQYILDKYQIQDLDQVVMIGDKAQDLIGAETCGVYGIGVTYGFGSYEELANEKHMVILSKASEVADYIMNWH